jgi:hypothetical protein
MRAGIGAGVALAATVFASAALGLPPFTGGPKTSPPAGTAQADTTSIAVGCHAGFDRFVIRLRLGTPGYDVRTVPQVVKDPSGLPLPLLGSARLLVVLHQARAHTVPAVLTPLCSNLLQVKKAGDFEGVVSFGLGLKHTAGFRVFRLTGPTRVVVDVSH